MISIQYIPPNIINAFMKIVSLILLLSAVACLSASGQNIDSISSMLRLFEKDLDFNGVVLIAKGDDVLLHQGYGFLDKKKSITTDKNAIYNIASLTKSFNGIAIVKLAEQQGLSLDDSLGKLFANVPPDKAGITIHQLLVHQSGLPQSYAAEGETNSDKAVDKIWKLKSLVRPGEKFIYSNDNYTLLGVIIEKVTGKRWKDYIRETILVPLDMANTFFWSEDNRTGLPMVIPKEKIKQQSGDYGYMGATGMFSNAVDLLKLRKVFESNALFNDTAKTLLLGDYVKLKSASPGSTDYYGYGIFHTTGEKNSIWLRGNEEGWGTAIAYWFPNSKLSIVVLSSSEQLKNGEKPNIYVSSQIIKQLQQ
jgi:CubicO group peptidase (beta-lactamase class C family)